jgi:hypothetical protein
MPERFGPIDAPPCGEKVTATSVSPPGGNTPPAGETTKGDLFVPPAVGATTDPSVKDARQINGARVGFLIVAVVVHDAPNTQSPQSMVDANVLDSSSSSFSSNPPFFCFPSIVALKSTPSPFNTTRAFPTGVRKTKMSSCATCARLGLNSMGILVDEFGSIGRNAASAANTPSWSSCVGDAVTRV